MQESDGASVQQLESALMPHLGSRGLSDSVMYNPLAEEDVSPEQVQFLRKYFVDVGYKKDLAELIKNECPVASLFEETDPVADKID